MNYFITGGAGFIGSTMVDALLERGNVTVYDNFSSGRHEFLAHHVESGRFTIIQGDLGDLDHLKRALRGQDVVFHFASNPDIARGLLETDLDLRQGTLLTYNVLEAMRVNQVKAILYSSGSGIYGDVGTTPTAEYFGPLLPISLYGASKLACEGLISAFCHMYDMTGHVFRFANVVGRRQTHGVGYDFIKRLRENPEELTVLGDGTQSKSYIHVSDVTGAMLFVFANCPDRVSVHNVATDDYVDVTTIAGIVLEEMGLTSTMLKYTGGDRGWKGDVPKVRFVLDKIHALGWRAQLNSVQAIRKSVREMLGRE